MKYDLKKSFIALGFTLTFLLATYKNIESAKKFIDKIREEAKSDDDNIKIEEVIKEYNREELYVFDMKYAQRVFVYEGKKVDNNNYYIMQYVKDPNYIKFRDLININGVGYFERIANIYDSINELGSYINRGNYTKEISLDGVIPLTNFLRDNNLSYLIKDTYTEDDIQNLYKTISKINPKNTYKIDDLFVADVKNAPNIHLSNKVFLLESKTTSYLDQYLIDYCNHNYKLNATSYSLISVVDNSHAIIDIGDNKLIINLFCDGEYGCCSTKTGLTLKPLKTYLEDLYLVDLIKDEYTKEELEEIYSCINPHQKGQILLREK